MGWKSPQKVFESSLVSSSIFMSFRLDQNYYLMTPESIQQCFPISKLCETEMCECSFTILSAKLILIPPSFTPSFTH